MGTPARILDPSRVQVLGTDSHLPAIPAERLTLPALRRRFARRDIWTPEIDGDGRLLADHKRHAAAVLIALVPHDDGLHVLLTRRSAHLRSHAGQISFPGGRVERGDADVIAAALRETEEEVGLPAPRVEVIGQLPSYLTTTNFAVTPVVGAIDRPVALTLDPSEVDEAFEVPLEFLMTPANHRRHEFESDGLRRQFLSIPWQRAGAAGATNEYFIWGATAAMLRNLYSYLSR